MDNQVEFMQAELLEAIVDTKLVKDHLKEKTVSKGKYSRYDVEE